MAKLEKKQIAELGKLGITSKKSTAEDAKEILIKKLAEQGVDDTDDEDLHSLMQMYESFVDLENEEEPEDEESHDEEEEYEELAEEVEEDEEEEEVKPIKKIAPISKKPIKAVKLEEEEEELEEEEEIEMKSAKKKITIAGKQVEVKKGGTPAVKSKPETKKKATPVKNSSVTAFDCENEEHLELLQPFAAAFPKLNVEIKPLKKGMTMFALMKSSKKAVISYDRVRLIEGELKGDLFFNILRGKEEVEQHIETDRDLKNFNKNLVFVSNVTVEEGIELLNKEFIKMVSDRLTNVDKRMTQAREKMEADLKVNDKKVAAKSTQKVSKKVVEVEEDEEEEEIEEIVVKKKVVIKKK